MRAAMSFGDAIERFGCNTCRDSLETATDHKFLDCVFDATNSKKCPVCGRVNFFHGNNIPDGSDSECFSCGIPLGKTGR